MSHSKPYANVESYFNAKSDSDGDSNTEPDSNSHNDAESDTDCYADPDFYSDAFDDPVTYVNAKYDAKSGRYSYYDADGNFVSGTYTRFNAPLVLGEAGGDRCNS